MERYSILLNTLNPLGYINTTVGGGVGSAVFNTIKWSAILPQDVEEFLVYTTFKSVTNTLDYGATLALNIDMSTQESNVLQSGSSTNRLCNFSPNSMKRTNTCTRYFEILASNNTPIKIRRPVNEYITINIQRQDTSNDTYLTQIPAYVCILTFVPIRNKSV